MENKTKFITIGLIGGLVICLLLFIQTLNSKQLILRERDDLKKENITLSGKLDKLDKSIKQYEDRIGLLSQELDKVSQEKQELEKKYESAGKDREKLIERLKSKAAEVKVVPQPQAEVLPPDTDAYWAGILKAKTDLELQLGNLRNELKSTQITNEELERGKTTFGLDINNLKRENEDLKRQLEYNQKTMDSISQGLVREKNDKIKIQEILKSIKSENAVLTRHLKSLNERKINLEKKFQGLQEKNAAIEQKFNDMQTMLTDKLSQINNLKEELDAIRGGAKAEVAQEKRESVELPPIIVRPQPETATQAASATLTGKILAINKESNFVIMDLGEEAGIKVGDSFQVYRDNKSIATIEVIQTRRNIAACDIKKETAPIKIGDDIVR